MTNSTRHRRKQTEANIAAVAYKRRFANETLKIEAHVDK